MCFPSWSWTEANPHPTTWEPPEAWEEQEALNTSLAAAAQGAWPEPLACGCVRNSSGSGISVCIPRREFLGTGTAKST